MQITKQFIIHFVETDKKPKNPKIVNSRFINALILRLYNTRDFDSETIYLKTVKVVIKQAMKYILII